MLDPKLVRTRCKKWLPAWPPVASNWMSRASKRWKSSASRYRPVPSNCRPSATRSKAIGQAKRRGHRAAAGRCRPWAPSWRKAPAGRHPGRTGCHAAGHSNLPRESVPPVPTRTLTSKCVAGARRRPSISRSGTMSPVNGTAGWIFETAARLSPAALSPLSRAPDVGSYRALAQFMINPHTAENMATRSSSFIRPGSGAVRHRPVAEVRGGIRSRSAATAKPTPLPDPTAEAFA